MQRGQKVGSIHVLRGKHTVDRFEGKLAPAVEKVRQVRLPETCLASQKRDAERTPLNPAQQFQAEFLVHLQKIHLWKFRHEKWVRNESHFFKKTSRAESPLFAASACHQERACGEIAENRLTQKHPVSRLCLLNLALACGKSMLKRLIAAKVRSDGILSLPSVNEHSAGERKTIRQSHQSPEDAQQRHSGQLSRENSRFCALKS
jgi:hypothetical protein